MEKELTIENILEFLPREYIIDGVTINIEREFENSSKAFIDNFIEFISNN